jgi:hypothetical protein
VTLFAVYACVRVSEVLRHVRGSPFRYSFLVGKR